MAQANARQWQRFSYRADVQLRWGNPDTAPPAASQAVCGGRAVNLSQGGLLLRARDAPSVGAAVSCELSCAGRWTALPGRVRWRSNPPQPDLGTELGIEFGPLSEDQSASVHALLASVDGAGQTVELKLPELRAPLPARAVLTDRGVRLRASLPLLATGSELDFELADPPLHFAGRVARCELKRSGTGWELELLVEERDEPRSRRYTMYQLPQLAPSRAEAAPAHSDLAPSRSDGSRRSTLTGATSPLPVLAAAVRESIPPEPANDPRRLEVSPPRAARTGSPLMAAGPGSLELPPLMAASPAHSRSSALVPSAVRGALAGERRRAWLVEQPYPAPLEARAVRDHDTEELPSVPKARAPRLISQLLAVLLGFGVAITLGRSALRQREADEAGALPIHPRGVDSLPLAADPDAPSGSAPPLRPSAKPAPAAEPARVQTPDGVHAEQLTERETISAPVAPAPRPAAAAEPQPSAATAAPQTSESALHTPDTTPKTDTRGTPPANAAKVTSTTDVAETPTVVVDGDTTEVFIPAQGPVQGFHEAIWVDPIAFVIDLPQGTRVAFQGQRIDYNTGGVTAVGAGKSPNGVTQVRVFLDGLLARYSTQTRSDGLTIRLRLDLQPMR